MSAWAAPSESIACLCSSVRARTLIDPAMFAARAPRQQPTLGLSYVVKVSFETPTALQTAADVVRAHTQGARRGS